MAAQKIHVTVYALSLMQLYPAHVYGKQTSIYFTEVLFIIDRGEDCSSPQQDDFFQGEECDRFYF